MKRQPSRGSIAAALTVVMLLVVVLTPPVRAAAGTSEELRMERLTVDLRPEYDARGEMLAIYQATYVNTAERPATADVALWVPAGARLGETCELTAEGEHVCQLPRVSQAEGVDPGDDGSGSQGLWVRWSMGRALAPGERYRAHMEFYVPVDVSRPERTVTFRYPGSPTVDRIQVHFMRPAAATGFTSDPEPTSGASSGTAPVFYYEMAPNAGTPVTLTARYARSTSEPFAAAAASGEQGSGESRPPSGAPGSMLLSQVGSWGLGVVVLAVLTYFLVRETTGRGRQRTPAHAAARGGGSGGSTAGGARHRHPESPQAGRPSPRRLQPEEERRLARQALLEGRISEATYRELVSDLQEKSR
ncbi:hypothetical protein [Limnochorda pilosa]|uniref:Uncharacterized protein n=1 Tax=Limnochorda pilosa TaxID=1555112 RepID=A0A0K2SR12_LIMPI|nr:hypothetical protein [Limnochorda pilosa]BAS29254.1 hypothetical protein LIP_3442 [Limnochorda pilosa]